MVPNGWKKGVIEDIAKVSSGGTPSRQNDSYWIGGNVPWVTTTEVKFGVITNTEQKITEEGLKNSSAKLFPKDTVLMAMYGQGKTRGQVAKLGIEASTNQACAALLLKDGFEVDYYYQYLVSQYENIRELANSGGQQNLSAGIIKGIHIPIPPILEQQKIAKILNTWDKAISTTERLIDNSKQQKKALMQQLLTGKKRLLDDSGKPFEGEWKDSTIGNLGTIYSGGTPSTSKREYWDGGIDWVTPTDITKQDRVYINSSVRKISAEGLKNSSAKLVPKGSLLVCTRATIGEMAITAHEMCTNQGFKNIIPNENTNIEFVFYLLTYEKHKLVSKASGSTFLELSKSAFETMKFNVPIIEEQKKIAAVLTNADEEIELLEQQLADLNQEKKALMQQLLTGKRRVKTGERNAA